MKKILFRLSFMSLFLINILTGILAAEKNIDLYIHNTKWNRQTHLTGEVNYVDRDKKDISFVIEGITSANPKTILKASLPQGKINKLELYLTTYSEIADSECSNTQLGGLVKDLSPHVSTSTLQSIILTITEEATEHDDIVVEFVNK